MKKNTKIILFIVVLAILTIGVGVVISENLRTLSSNFGLSPDFSDLVESDRQVTFPFNFTELPEYFVAGLVLDGSGYAGQPHSIGIWIGHNRNDSSVWLAAGDYSLTLKNGVDTEIIIPNSSFSGVRYTDPFEVEDHSWTSPSTIGVYDFVLSLTNLKWTMKNVYSINATAGLGGSILPSGTFTVLEGTDQAFVVTPDLGYAIEELTVNGFSISITSTFALTNITDNNNIEVTFVPITPIITASAGTGGTIDPSGVTTVLEGDDQTFTATAAAGYTFDSFLIDTILFFGSDTHTFTDVQADHTIHANFIENIGIYSESNTALELGAGPLNDWTGTIISCTFNEEPSMSILPGSSIHIKIKIGYVGDYTGWYYDYHFEVERVGGGYRHQIGELKTLQGPWGNENIRTPRMDFLAEAGDWVVILVVDAVYP